jgi:hypothetical protein
MELHFTFKMEAVIITDTSSNNTSFPETKRLQSTLQWNNETFDKEHCSSSVEHFHGTNLLKPCITYRVFVI